MKKFFGKLFGSKKEVDTSNPTELIADVVSNLFALAEFKLSYDLSVDEGTGDIRLELYGDDEEILIEKEGQVLDAIQLYLKRVLQHQIPEEHVNVHVDCAGFREQANQTLIDLADKLKSIAMDKGKPVYFRALPPRDRKVIHQHLAADGRVKSRSIGDGLYKKIKIYPIKGEEGGGVARHS